MNESSETIVFYGGEVKALDDEGKIGGYLVRFSGPKDPDLAGDFFTKETDFGPINQSPILYHHGMDGTLKSQSLGLGNLKIDDVGVWLEGQLELRDEYEKAIFGMAKGGKLGWSSGTASHLVEREMVGKSWHIKSWPLGLDASLTPTPCEPRTKAIPLKSYQAELEAAKTETIKVSTETPAQGVVASVDDDDKAVNFNLTVKMQNKTDTGAENVEVKETSITAPANVEPTQHITLSKADYDELQSKAFSQEPERVVKASHDVSTAAINVKTKRGDDFAKAYVHYLRTGDEGGVKHLVTSNMSDSKPWSGTPGNTISIKAPNDTDMNIGTAADGGNAVPTGHFNQIIARRDEGMLAANLGVRNIPGVGTTVNVPIDNEADVEFTSTAEAATNQRDAPAIGQVAMTLAKYTKMIELSDELLQDEESNVLAFLSDWVGRSMASQHNNLLITAADTNGTSITTFTGTDTIAAGELQDMMYNDALEPYLDDGGSVGWVTRRSTHGAIAKLQGNDFIYDMTPQGNGAGRTLLGVPVNYSVHTDALATGNKPILLGNWFYMGVRNEPEFRLLRDPYSAARAGQLRLHYYFRTVYAVLQAEAITYGTLA